MATKEQLKASHSSSLKKRNEYRMQPLHSFQRSSTLAEAPENKLQTSRRWFCFVTHSFLAKNGAQIRFGVRAQSSRSRLLHATAELAA
eukprot:5628387-Amphidinium_carterae.1